MFDYALANDRIIGIIQPNEKSVKMMTVKIPIYIKLGALDTLLLFHRQMIIGTK